MRFVVTSFAAVIFMLASFRCAPAAPPTSLDLQADRVVFYSNRYIVTGEGHVRVRLSDGTVLRSELFSMDLKLNRYLLAGDVHLDSDDVHEVGAGFAGYPDLDRSYFLSANGNPDKWTYLGLDFAHPQKGRAQPGDAFFIPDVSREKPYIVASSATILPKTNVQFRGSRLYVLGVFIPTGKWVQTFSANPNYAQNAFSGASFDIGLPYNGSLHAISAVHLRYSGISKLFLSFDQHFVWDRDYIVFSINPVTQEERQFNLIGYKRISPAMEARIFSQLSTAQHGIYQPEVASAYTNLSYVVALRHSALNLIADQYNTSLLQYPVPLNPSGAEERAYDHPSDFTLSWTGRDTPLTKYTPVNLRLRSGFGLAHDGYHCGPFDAFCLNDPRNKTGQDLGYVLDYFGADRTRVPTIAQKFFGFTLYTSSLPLDKLRSLNLNLTLDKQRQWFSLPHHIDTTTTTASLSKTYTRKLAFLGAYSLTQTGDDYGARQREFYPVDPLAFDGIAYPGYEAFRGFSTSRSLTGSAVVTPNEYFNYAFTVRRGYDFPAPVPGLFGIPPWQITNEFRFRIAKQILMDVTRTDYFNFGGYGPSFSVLFGP
ncbi:MAG: hypothetical protein ABSB70_15725 [Candidatus Velthaea sp.]